MDRRVERSRAALRSAFNQLILERGFDKLTAADVADLANVGRSTFYAHYTGLNELLAESIGPILTPLANSAVGDDPGILPILEHIWENRAMGRNLMAGETRRRLLQLLGSMVETRLTEARRAAGHHTADPSAPLVALQIAGGQLAMLEAWLAGRTPATAARLAELLRSGSRAMADAWLQGAI